MVATLFMLTWLRHSLIHTPPPRSSAQAPVVFLFTITNPVVDFEEEDQNWKQYLQMLQCLTSPIFFVFGTNCERKQKKGGRHWFLRQEMGSLLTL